jgi:hypothetical protein
MKQVNTWLTENKLSLSTFYKNQNIIDIYKILAWFLVCFQICMTK